MVEDNSNTNILVVDDDPRVRRLLRRCLEDEGFVVFEAGSSSELHSAFRAERIDLVTLDLSLGDESGLDIARQICGRSGVPVIMVTAKSDVIDRVVGLEVGADDYITKPFHPKEVAARVRSVLRRSRQSAEPARSTGRHDSPAYTFDGMTVVPERMEVIDRHGMAMDLTAGDFRLLEVFLERPKRVLSRDQIISLLGGTMWSPLDRTVDNQVARLRKKIERDPGAPRIIRTVRGIGYMMASEVARTRA